MSSDTKLNQSGVPVDREGASPVGKLLPLAFATLGVVYGDIGTSPLYAIKECFNPEFGLSPTIDNVIGICSLFFWSIFLIVVVKYLIFVMRADNKGEGGILALLALAVPRLPFGQSPKGVALMTTMLALVGTGLLGADGTITPAISVLSAVEGLATATSRFKPYVLPITISILIAVFAIQKRGTARISILFAPIMLVWFLLLIVLAVPQLVAHPGIFAALNPFRGIKLLLTHGFHGFFVLGAVVLCVTGAEALYADMGHFGRRAIKWAWFPVVYPALILNYFGQGAAIIGGGASVAANPFFSLAPDWAIYPVVGIATLATIIASQALISGSFSVAQQAVQLGFCPRLTVVHTSGDYRGQIYIPEINTMLMISCIASVLLFKTSTALAGAYGISVMGTMTITSFLIYRVAVTRWGWKPWRASLLLIGFLAVDLPFLFANAPKIEHGGWFPLAISAVVFAIMATWKRGRAALVRKLQKQFFPIEDFVKIIAKQRPHRIEGTGIFMTSNPRITPPALQHHYTHNQVLHTQVLLLSIMTEDVPVMPMKDVLEVTNLGCGFYEVIAHFGFMQTPKVDKILRLCRVQAGINYDENRTTYYLGRDILLINGPDRMARWRKVLFSFLVRNSLSATAYYGIPPNRVVELGMQVSL